MMLYTGNITTRSRSCTYVHMYVLVYRRENVLFRFFDPVDTMGSL